MYPATVLEVLIASPAETEDQRQAIRSAVVNWNSSNARYLGVVLLPVMWETHTYRDLAGPPQAMINKQIVDDADILIATFWTTVGTPTAAAPSGTVEEIERFLAAGKPVFVYFCEMPAVPIAVDAATRATAGVSRAAEGPRAVQRLHLDRRAAGQGPRGLNQRIYDLRDEGVVQAPDGPPAEAPTADEDGGARQARLEQFRDLMQGYVLEWQARLAGLDEHSLDQRQDLLRDIERTTFELLRFVGSEDPNAPVLEQLSRIASGAGRLARQRVYMDGGKTFGALSTGVETAVREASDAVAQPWHSS